ncbi:hypothetical protein WICPIJ_004267 [Wickerhamomyces pijperi]|uniref:Uncharacterized protein n=1 Tax=Wickerhamomyces pijperi TaxID=599730 RepID=A0A9P8TMX2_WICPI|nr:hypothetical protein WICPIJ_004267 [Wickerhamomyces pijperi]
MPASVDLKTKDTQNAEPNFRKLLIGTDSNIGLRQNPLGVDSSFTKSSLFPSADVEVDVDRLVDELIKENEEAMREVKSPFESTKRKKHKKRRELQRVDTPEPVSLNLEEEELIYALLESNNKSDDEEEETLQQAPPNSPSPAEGATKPHLISGLTSLVAAETGSADKDGLFDDLGMDSFSKSETSKTSLNSKNFDELVSQKKKSQSSKVNDYLSIKLPKVDLYPYCKLAIEQIHLQNLWVLSHLLTILGILFYLYGRMSNNNELEYYSYKVGTMGSVLTYLIVLYRANFEEQIVEFNENKNEVTVKTKIMTMSEFVRNENAQLLGFVILWNFTPMSIIKLAPFFIYSGLNLTSFFTLEIIPDYSFSTALLPLLSYLEVPLLITASHFDLISFGVVLRESIEESNAYPFVIFSFIWLLRYESSEACRSSFNLIFSFVLSLFTQLTSLPSSFGKKEPDTNVGTGFTEKHNGPSTETRFQSMAESLAEDGGSSATLTAEIQS